MKKFIYLALIVLLLGGCSITKVEEDSFESIINSVLYNMCTNKHWPKYNHSIIYLFYMPMGIGIYPDAQKKY